MARFKISQMLLLTRKRRKVEYHENDGEDTDVVRVRGAISYGVSGKCFAK